ncbi:hypothetical protein N9K75_02170 [bacterium]|nr:hypothetical protein [bacterium]
MNNLVKFSDGDGDDFTSETEFVTIESADNGFVIHISSDDGDSKTVFAYKDRKEMMKFIEGALGL